MGVLLAVSTACKFLSALASSNFLSLLIVPSATCVANFLPCLPFLFTPRQWVGEALHLLLILWCPSLLQDDHVPKLEFSHSLVSINCMFSSRNPLQPTQHSCLPRSSVDSFLVGYLARSTVPLQGVLLWCLPCWHGGWKVCRPSVGQLGKTQR